MHITRLDFLTYKQRNLIKITVNCGARSAVAQIKYVLLVQMFIGAEIKSHFSFSWHLDSQGMCEEGREDWMQRRKINSEDVSL